MHPEERVYNFWLIVRPAEDIPGTWIAHCLELDVVTQGTSPTHAVQMAMEAIPMVVSEDLARGRDPLARRAPAEYWDELYDLLAHAQIGRLSDLKPEQIEQPEECPWMAGQLVVRHWSEEERNAHEQPRAEIPALWTSQPGSGAAAATG